MSASVSVLLSFFVSSLASTLPISTDMDRDLTSNAIPRFLSRGQTYRVVIGDTLVLPCEVEDLGEYVLLWRRGSAVLTADKIMVIRDPRFQLVDGFNLQVSNVMPQDAGDYVCQIGDGDNRDQIHTVEILVPPSIRTSPANGQLTARKGGTITLECKPSGNPVPTIMWTRKFTWACSLCVNFIQRVKYRPLSQWGFEPWNCSPQYEATMPGIIKQYKFYETEQNYFKEFKDNVLPSGEKSIEGFAITLDKVDRHQAGVYQCTASNGVGDPVTVDMQLDVLYPPEIEVERSWVHSGEGYEAQLVCIVHGEPAPNMIWYQDSFLLDPTERRTMDTRANKHTLTIRNVQSSDFGNYSCVADNSLGRAKKYMELSGKPSPAEFRSAPFSRARDSYNLTWMVESYPPLDEVRLLFRKVMMNDTHQNHGKWHDVMLQPTNGETFSHLMSYNIRGLDAASVYEAIVQAKNRYGWSEVTDAYKFYTRGPGQEIYDYPSEPNMEDMELIASANQSCQLIAFPSLLAVILAFILL